MLVGEDGRELAVLSQEGQRFIVPLDEVNPVVVDALLSAEDRRFYDHGGVDPIGITRALVSNLRHSGTQGGSTLTQQLVKNEYLTNERSLWRKAREAVLSVKLERSEDKDQILERYLNTVYFGRGAYGIEAAARAYFDTSAAELDARAGRAARRPAPLAGDRRPGGGHGRGAGPPRQRAGRHGRQRGHHPGRRRRRRGRSRSR